MPRSKVVRISPELEAVLRHGMDDFNRTIAIPRYRKPVDFVKYSEIAAIHLEKINVSEMEQRSALWPPRKRRMPF